MALPGPGGVMICHLAVLESLMAVVLDGWLACCLRGTIPEDELPYLGQFLGTTKLAI